ncbi:MAG TPA: DUF2239 family protein [Roseiarcus sp.]|jgi:hypothetical protein
MTESPSRPCAAFAGSRLIVAGPLRDVALTVRDALAAGTEGPVLAFDDASGAVIDLDLRGSDADILARLGADEAVAETRGRGRPKLGVVAREVTLLPRHWEWLAAQPGGASVALRRLVDEARRADGGASEGRRAKAAAFRFLSAMAGDLPGFEEALRAMFADDQAGFAERASPWPTDIRDYATRLAFNSARSAT